MSVPALRGTAVTLRPMTYDDLPHLMRWGSDPDFRHYQWAQKPGVFAERNARAWIERMIGFALVPHKVFYLRAGVKDLVSRVVLGRGHFDYWESGMDLRFGKDMYDSFVKYQTRLIHVFDRLAKTYDIEMIDATRTADEIFHELQTSISRLFTPQHGMRRVTTSKPATKSA